MDILHGAELGVDLERLRRLGRKDLADVGIDYAHFSKSLAKIFTPAEKAMGGGAPFGTAFEAWSKLQDAFQKNLADTAESLSKACAAIEWIVDEYSSIDTGAAQELKDSWHEGPLPKIPNPSRSTR